VVKVEGADADVGEGGELFDGVGHGDSVAEGAMEALWGMT
jgi:hypothetical protein